MCVRSRFLRRSCRCGVGKVCGRSGEWGGCIKGVNGAYMRGGSCSVNLQCGRHGGRGDGDVGKIALIVIMRQLSVERDCVGDAWVVGEVWVVRITEGRFVVIVDGPRVNVDGHPGGHRWRWAMVAVVEVVVAGAEAGGDRNVSSSMWWKTDERCVLFQ